MIDLTGIATVMQWQTPNDRTLWCARAVGSNTFSKGETAEEAIRKALGDLQPVATACSACGAPQFDTPSGVTCKNGHGGAPAATNDDVSDLF